MTVYNTQWYNCSARFQRLILLVIIRANKPQSITAWKFFDMSIETFQWVERLTCLSKK